MSTVICFPENDGTYKIAKIYRANSALDEYSLLDTVNARQCEYEDSDGRYTSCYKIAFSDGITDQPQVAVKSLIQQIIETIRIELKVSESIFPDSNIYYLFETCQAEIMSDICTYYQGIQLSKVTDKIYQLPNRYFFDYNFGGSISVLDFEFYKQTIPIYIYTEKVPVVPVYVDPDAQYVELSEPISSNEVLKVNYYSMGRKVKHSRLLKLIAYKLCSSFYDNYPTDSSIAQNSKIKIGDISVQTGTSASYYVDLAIKMNAKYKQLVTNFKTGFYRMN